ncbi:MAG: DUF4342 domain-containing protein [Candidatus Aegiribacteria sp.]|nr:DUF4342 domain-containing protein [Candidatus Aegiribacteria sp.]
MQEEKSTTTKEFHVCGKDLVSKLKEILHQGNIRHIMIINDDGRTLIEVPMTLGAVAVVLLPVWAAIGAIAALVANCTIVVKTEEE